MNLQQLLEVDLNQRLQERPELLANTEACLQLEVEGEYWHINLKKERAVKNGHHPEPDLELSLAKQDLRKLIEGKLNIPMALAFQKIKVNGNPMLLMKLKELFG